MDIDNQYIEKTGEWHQFCRFVLSEQLANLTPLHIDTESSENFIQFLHKHGLEALLLDLLEQQNCADLLADSVVERLIEFRRFAHIKEIYRKQHLQSLLKILNADQIDSLILKGTAFAYHLYQQPYQRSRFDTDIFINIKDKEKIDQTLTNHGFSKATNVSGDLISHQNTYWQTKNNIKHAYDIHWRISNRNAYAHHFN